MADKNLQMKQGLEEVMIDRTGHRHRDRVRSASCTPANNTCFYMGKGRGNTPRNKIIGHVSAQQSLSRERASLKKDKEVMMNNQLNTSPKNDSGQNA